MALLPSLPRPPPFVSHVFPPVPCWCLLGKAQWLTLSSSAGLSVAHCWLLAHLYNHSLWKWVSGSGLQLSAWMAEGVPCVGACIRVCPSAWQSGHMLVVTEAQGRGLTHLFPHPGISVAGSPCPFDFQSHSGTALLPGVSLASTRT